MRECSGISDVIDYWSHFIVTMMATLATLACRAAMPNVDVGMAHISKQ
jgi:hypothetical protein